MSSLQIFNLASNHAKWLTARQVAIAGNVANVNTPGYRASDVAPFAAALDATQLEMTTTSAAHMIDPRASAMRIDVTQGDPWEIQHSGNSVSLEQEMIKASDVKSAFTLDTTIVKTFNRMLMMSAKG